MSDASRKKSRRPARGTHAPARPRRSVLMPVVVVTASVGVACIAYFATIGSSAEKPAPRTAAAEPVTRTSAPATGERSAGPAKAGAARLSMANSPQSAEPRSPKPAKARPEWGTVSTESSTAEAAALSKVSQTPPALEPPATASPATPPAKDVGSSSSARDTVPSAAPEKPEPYDGPFYVSPGGDDANPGTAEKPFRTLERAREAVRRCSARGKKTLKVLLKPGRYFRTATFRLGAEDSGSEDAPVVYAALERGEAIIDGGIEIPPDALRRVTDPALRRRLVPGAAGAVREIDLARIGVREYGEFGPRGFGRPTTPAPNELFVNGKPQRIARWPNEGRIKLGKVIDGGSVPRNGDKSSRGAVFEYETPRALRWTGATGFYVSGIFGQAWADDSIKVAKLDTKAGTITTAGPHVYGFRNRNFTTWCAVNLLEEIDMPGEYFIDRAAQKVYLLPAVRKIRRLQLSVMTEPLVAVRNASHVRIEGLVFENARGQGIDVRDGTGIVFAGCTLRNLGGLGISASGGSRHVVRACDVHGTGAGGVSVSGGDRKTLRPAGHVVEDCDIHHVNRWYWTYKPCVRLGGVGNMARHNHLHHVPGQAILFGGNDHVMEFNEIDHCVTDMSDMGSIYAGRNPSVCGHVIRHNFFHHMEDTLGHGAGVQAIFIDDDNLYTAVIFGNVFYKTGSNAAIKFNGGGGATIANNIFVDCPRPVQGGDEKHVDRAIKRMRDPNWKHKTYQKITEEVDIRKEPYKSRYPYLLDTFENGFNYGTPQWNNFVTTRNNSQFVDGRRMNFALRRGSPVLRTVARNVYDRVYGVDHKDVRFEPIPFGRIGPRRDHREERARTRKASR